MPTVEEVQKEVADAVKGFADAQADLKKRLDAHDTEMEAMKARGERPEGSAEHTKAMAEIERRYDESKTAITAAQAELIALKGDTATKVEELIKAMQRPGSGRFGEGGEETYKTAGQRFVEEVIEKSRPQLEALAAGTARNLDALPRLSMKGFGQEPAYLGIPQEEVKKALSTAATTNFVPPFQIPGYMQVPRRSLRIADLLPTVPTQAQHILYIRQTGFSPTATASVTLAQTAGLATATQAAHGYEDFDQIKISGAVQAGYNGSHRIKVVDANTYTFAVASGTVSPATGTIVALRMNNYGAANFIAEAGGAKAETQMFFEERTAAVQTVAHWIQTTRQVLDDVPGLRQEIDGDLMYGLQLKKDKALLYATGVSPQTSGILTDPDIQVYAWSNGTTGDTKLDAIRRSRTLVELADGEASGCVLHPTVWESIELQKATTGEYIWVTGMNGLSPGGEAVWRMPLVISRAIAASTWLVGAFPAATVYDREQANVRFSENVGTDFIENMIRLLAEERFGLAIRRPEWFVKGTFDAAPA